MAESEIFHILVTVAVLLFAAKLLARLVNKLKQSAVLGEIVAGIIIGPFALGGLPLINGEPLVVIDETILHIGEVAAIIILFVAVEMAQGAFIGLSIAILALESRTKTVTKGA